MSIDKQIVKFEVATPVGLALSVDASSVQAPSIYGEFGVLAGHVPLLATLRPGVISYQEGNETRRAAIGSGFAEAGPDKVLILTDEFVASKDVDSAKASADLAEAEGKLKAFQGPLEGPEYLIIQRAIDWARARLEISAN